MKRYAPGVSIVTGGASGIGRALVTELALRGGRVVAADVDGDGARHTSSVLTSRGYAVTPAVLDVTDREAVGALVREVAGREGRLDLMVNNAGIPVTGPVADLEHHHFERAVDVNLWGVVHGALAALEVMRGQEPDAAGRRGAILSTGSLAGLIIAPRMLPYLVSKHAVVAFSRGLALEAAEDGVAVHVVCPDFVETPLLDDGSESPSGAKTFRHVSGGLQPRLSSPAAVARRAVDGIGRGSTVIPVGAFAHLMWRVERAAPAVFDLASRRVVRD